MKITGAGHMYRKKRRRVGIRINTNRSSGGTRQAREYNCENMRDHIYRDRMYYDSAHEVSNNNQKYSQTEYFKESDEKTDDEVSNNYSKYPEYEYNFENSRGVNEKVSNNGIKYSYNGYFSADTGGVRYGKRKRRSSGSYAGRGTRRLFSMAAWTASFIMVLNMLPADSPVSQALARYEESFPAMSLGLEELKNGPDAAEKSENSETQEIDGSFVKTALIVSDGAMPVNDGNGGSVNETGGNESNGSAVSAVTLNGIKLVLSDSGSKSSAQGSAAGILSSQPAATAQGNTSSKVQGSASSQENASAVLTNNTATAAKTVNVSNATGSGDIIIYHTHATEAYAPVANAETTHSTNAAGTVREAGDNLSAALTAKGYNVIHDKTLHDSPSYNKSYNRSLERLKKLLSEHKSPKLVIDFHRDAATASGKAKTAKINNETVASFALVVGTKNDNYTQIRALADKIVKKANEMYPGFCTGVIEKPYKFNGYLSNNYILLELGNNANTIDQINAAVPYLADVFTNVVK